MIVFPEKFIDCPLLLNVTLLFQNIPNTMNVSYIGSDKVG